jgi:undecaprenyl-diphosphatase
LLAIIIFFWSKIKALRLNDYWLLGIATLPAVVVGLIGETAVELVFAIPLLMGFFLIITGAINLISQQLLNKPVAQIAKLIPGKAVMIGVFQSLALIPGISRSGATLLGSFIQGLNQERAFTFTFLLAIPAILGANSLQILRLTTQQQALPTSEILLAGGLGALVASLLSLKILQKLISQAKLAIFSWYCFLLGGGVVLIQLMR